jgi:hypothetical protein
MYDREARQILALLDQGQDAEARVLSMAHLLPRGAAPHRHKRCNDQETNSHTFCVMK